MATAAHADRAEESVFETLELAGVARMFERDVNAVILRRALPPAVDGAVDQLLAAAMPANLKLVVEPGEHARVMLRGKLGAAEALVADLERWIGLVADLTDAALVGVRLARVQAAMCPRFHSDRVLVRLVTTYRGPGTELVAESDVDRRFLSPNHGGLSDECSGLLAWPGAICRADAGDVVLMKGELWPGNFGRGAVHRSPHSSEPRVVVTIDPLDYT